LRWSDPQLKDRRQPVAAQPVALKETNGLIQIKAGGLVVTFDHATGWLTGVRRCDQFFSLTNGPRFTGGTGVLTKMDCSQEGSEGVVSAKFTGGLQSILWRVKASGWIQCDYTYAARGTNDFLGVTFDYPEGLVKSKRWLGDGPYRVWKNRRSGVTLGLWQNGYNNTITGWRDWIYPEFKGCFAGVRWLQLNTTEGRITVVNDSAVPFVQVLTPEFPPVKLAGHTIPPLPTCGLGFLDIIPPMGSKFQAPEVVSPSGERTLAHGDYFGSVSFYFGE
jgi:hypothetical protein